MPRVEVDLPGNEYAIHIGSDLLPQLGPELRALGGKGAAVVVTHPEMPPAYRSTATRSLEQAGFRTETALVPQGEASKSLETLGSLYSQLAAMQLDRRSTLVALGGGVIGDLTGFAAATYLRGIHLVQVPTTLLAQVDASVGGKTAIDLPAGKNLVGAFHQPRLVIADVGTLQSLPSNELRSGLAEIVKYGVIADPALFDLIERDAPRALAGEEEMLTRLVVRSCEIKATVVRQDPQEQGLRAILNYGHTVGHALESVLGYGAVTHGEAVAFGMSAAARLAVQLGLLDSPAAVRQDALLQRLGLPTLATWGGGPGLRHPLPEIGSLLDAMKRDKKTLGGRLRFVLARCVGTVEVHEVADAEVVAVLETAGT
jgi:3-dehydroquinate synthase